jgi:hypothetical protein
MASSTPEISRDCVEFSSRLVEETLWTALKGHAGERAFHAEREPIYRLADPEERDRAFARLHERWFADLRLGEPVLLALSEQDGWPARVSRIRLVAAISARQEAGELFVAGPSERSVAIAILPATLADGRRALALLRRELMHVSDMLDPAFAYEPTLPRRPVGPAHDRVLQDRYRALWRCSVDGRLVGAGKLEEGVRAERLRDIEGTFSSLGERVTGLFERLFAGPRPCHAELVRIAQDPERALGPGPTGPPDLRPREIGRVRSELVPG